MSDAPDDVELLATLLRQYYGYEGNPTGAARWLVEHGVTVRAVAPAGAPPEEIITIDDDGRVVSARKSTVLATPEREGPCDGRGERDTQEERPHQSARPASTEGAVANPPVTPAGAPSEAAIAAARAVAKDAEWERWDPSYKVRQMLRAAYAVDVGAAAPRDAPPETP